MRGTDDLLAQRLKETDSSFASIIEGLPPREEPYLPPNWLHFEMIERYEVLSHAYMEEGMNVLEIGAGAHAIATVPIACIVGDCGRVQAVEVERWHSFDEIVEASGLKKRVIPLSCDATHLPFPFQCFDIAVCIHGIRSLRSEETIVQILREMLRVSSRIFVAESLPISHTKAQEAHLGMYNLREEIFEALSGEKDDIHYFPLERLSGFFEKADGRVTESKVLEIGLPHFLAFIPKEYIEKIRDEGKKKNLARRWEDAHEELTRYGEEHPPVGALSAVRRECQ